MNQLTDDEIDSISMGNCPTCHGRGFVIGPQGGKSINIECASVMCRERYNVAFYSGRAMMAQRISNGWDGPAWPSEPGTDRIAQRPSSRRS